MNAAARTLRNADHRSLAPLALTITLVLAALLVAAVLALMFVLSDSGHGAGDKTGPTWGERDATFVEPTPSTLPRALNQRIQVPG
jgi:hypothetical protein